LGFPSQLLKLGENEKLNFQSSQLTKEHRKMNLNNSFRRAKYASLIAIVLLGVACKRAQTNEPTGPTTGELIARYRQPYAEMRERLKQIAQQLPPKDSVKNNVVDAKNVTRLNLNPAPTYIRSIKAPINDNMGVFAAEQLLDPEVEPDFDLALIGFPQHCFFWLSEKYTAKSNLNSADSGLLGPGFEAGLARRYLLVYRAARYDKPQVIDSSSFIPGAIDLEVFLVDFQSNKILTSFRASAQTSKEAKYPANANIEVHVVDTLRQNVRAVIADSLAKTAGGSLEFR